MGALNSLILKLLRFSFLMMMIGFETFETKVRRLPSTLSMLVFFTEQQCGWRLGQGLIDGSGSSCHLMSIVSISPILGPLIQLRCRRIKRGWKMSLLFELKIFWYLQTCIWRGVMQQFSCLEFDRLGCKYSGDTHSSYSIKVDYNRIWASIC